MVDELMVYDADQMRIIRAPAADVWISAGPGAGKTAILAHRIAELVKNGADPTRIVAVTYTRTMAADLKRRIAQALPDGATCPACNGTGKSSVEGFACDACHGLGTVAFQMPTVGTLHSLAAQWVRAALRGKLCGGQAALDTRLVRSPDFAIAQPEDVADLMDMIYQAGRKKIRKRDLTDGLKLTGRDLDQWTPITEVRRQLYIRDLVTYDDLLVLLHAVLGSSDIPTAECPSLRSQVEYMVVDEAQDLSAQHWLILLGGLNAIMTVAGDDAQSIFSFLDDDREPGEGGEFGQRLEQIGEGVYRIGRNYRSERSIVDTSNRLRRALHADGAAADLELSAYLGSVDGAVSFIRDADGIARAAQEVKHLIDGTGDPVSGPFLPDEIAVLARTWAELQEISVVLEELGVPHAIPEKGRDRWRSPSGRAVLALARTVERGRLDDADARIILRAMGHADPVGLVNDALDEAHRTHRELADVLSGRADSSIGLPLGWWSAVPRFADTVSLATHIAHAGPAFAESAQRMADWMPDVQIDENVDYCPPSPGDWLLWLASNEHDRSARTTAGHVTLSTIHGAKGLEWPAVVVYGATEGAIPSQMDRGTPAQIGESGRVLYVAMTRAKEALRVVSPTEIRGVARQPSRWLIDAGLVAAVEGMPLPREKAAVDISDVLNSGW